MGVLGRVESVWRYPVKSMRGEELDGAFVGFAGIHGDRVYALRSSSAPAVFPYLTAREQQRMLLYRPVYRHAERMVAPPLLAETEAMGPGLTPLPVEEGDWALDVETPGGGWMEIGDPRLLEELRGSIGEGGGHQLRLVRSERALTDCRPVSLISVQTVGQLGSEVGMELDKLRFRANIYLDLATGAGFGEDALVGRWLRIGAKVEIRVLERDPRCQMITLDPGSGEAAPEIGRGLARRHEGKAGVYAAVLVEGVVRAGDEVKLLG